MDSEARPMKDETLGEYRCVLMLLGTSRSIAAQAAHKQFVFLLTSVLVPFNINPYPSLLYVDLSPSPPLLPVLPALS